MSEENVVSIESAESWRETAREQAQQPAPDTSPLTLEEAAARYTQRRREQEGDDDVVEYRRSNGKDAISLKEAASDLSFSRKLAQGKKLLDAGLTKDQAHAIIEAPDEPVKVGRLDDKGLEVDSDEPVSVREAARQLANWRAEQAAEQARMLEELAGEEAQQAEVQQEEEQQRRQAEEAAQRQRAEHQRLLRDRAAIANAQRIGTAERQAILDGSKLLAQAAKEFPDLKTVQDIERLRVTQPQRYARYKQLEAAGNGKVAQIEGLAAQRQLGEVRAAAQARAKVAAAQDQADAQFQAFAEKSIPNWDKPEVQREVRAAANKMLQAHDPRAYAAIKSGQRVLSATEQSVLARAVLYEQMVEKGKQIRQTPLPPVQKPGVSRPAGAASSDQITSLERQLQGAVGHKAIKLATKLRAARRGAQA